MVTGVITASMKGWPRGESTLLMLRRGALGKKTRSEDAARLFFIFDALIQQICINANQKKENRSKKKASLVVNPWPKRVKNRKKGKRREGGQAGCKELGGGNEVGGG